MDWFYLFISKIYYTIIFLLYYKDQHVSKKTDLFAANSDDWSNELIIN